MAQRGVPQPPDLAGGKVGFPSLWPRLGAPPERERGVTRVLGAFFRSRPRALTERLLPIWRLVKAFPEGPRSRSDAHPSSGELSLKPSQKPRNSRHF